MKVLGIGFLISLIGVLCSYVFWGVEKLYMVSGIIGLLLIGICILFSGSMVSGDRMRANYATETYQDRQNRDRFVTRVFLLGLPNLVIAIGVYFLVK